MSTPDQIYSQITTLTSDLIGVGLCDRQNYPSKKTFRDNVVEVSSGSSEGIALALKEISYIDLYNELDRLSSYGIKMLDGALISFDYRFKKNELCSHRLAFFPSPYVEEFQNNPEVYLEDEVYAEVVSKCIVPFPLRFDYDIDPESFREVFHPKSHLTLGQYKNCRIPVSAGLTPFRFLDFILRNFYHTSFSVYSCNLTGFEQSFNTSIYESERKLVHVNV
ncbi:MAG: DUF2290 domain-containing protein [Pseudomonadota bacterium]|nr:DUF2290 domain-containing protein [Pseudomonadota bacterium]